MNAQALKVEVEKLFSELRERVHSLIDSHDQASQAAPESEAPVSGMESAATTTDDKPPTAAA